MVICKEIDDYLKYVKEHPKWINKKRKQLIKNIVKPLLKRNDIFFDKETYENCLEYCKVNYYELFPYQKFIYAFVFMYKKDDIPVFPKFFIKEGRGNGKDGFIVPLANFMQTPLYGVRNYHVEIVANSEDQVKDTFKVAYDMLHENAKFKGKFSVTKELITNLATGSEMKYNTSNAKTKDGKRTGCLVLNEIHAYENYDQINVFESSFGKVKHSREFIITTDGYVRDGPLDEISSMCAEILETGENPLGYYPFICEIDSMKEVDIPDAWHKANPSMEYMPILANQIMHDYLEMKKIPSKRPEFITKRMDRSARKEEETVTTWLNVLRACYEGSTTEELELKKPRMTIDTKGQPAVIGIDYADIRDFASAGVLTKTESGEYIWRQHTWICAESPFLDSIKFPLKNIGQTEFSDFEVVPGPVIDVNSIVDWCMERCAEYDVKKIAMDTYRYTLFKMAFEERGLTIEDRKNPNGVVRLIRKITSATGIIAPFIQSMFSQGMINFGASAIMRWYTNNTSVTEDKFGNKMFGRVYLESVVNQYNNTLNAINYMIRLSNQPKFKLKLGTAQSFREKQADGTDKIVTKDMYAEKIKRLLESEDITVMTESEGVSLENIQINASAKAEELAKVALAINNEAANAFDIPEAVFNGNITEQSDATNEFITYAVGPVAEVINDTLTAYIVGEDDYSRKNEKVMVWLARFKHVDVVDSAVNLDKLRGIGFSYDEIRAMVGYPLLNTEFSNARALTKNYGEEGDNGTSIKSD